MPFTFPLPDPESSSLINTVDDDGAPVLAPTQDTIDAVESMIAQQDAAIMDLIRQAAGVIAQQLQFQQQVITSAWQAIAAIIERQMQGQRAALDMVLYQVREEITLQLARQQESVGTTAIAVALQQPGPGPMPALPPSPGPGPSPPTPWAPVTPTQPGGPFTSPSGPKPPPPPGSLVGDAVPFTPHNLNPTPPVIAGPAPSGQQGGPISGDAVPFNPPIPVVPFAPAGGASGSQPPSFGFTGITPAGSTGGAVVQGEGDTIVNEEGDITVNVPPAQVVVGPAPAVYVTVNVDGQECAVNVSQEQRQIEVADESEERREIKVSVAPENEERDAPLCKWRVTDRLPAIGGPEWCRLQDQIAQGFADLGNNMLGLILQPLDIVAGGSGEGKIDRNAAGIAANLNPGMLVAAAVFDTFPKVAEVVRQVVACWRQLTQMAPQCQPTTLLGVLTARAVIRFLKRFQVGTDAGVWATVDFTLDLPQLERAIDYVAESLCPSKIPSAADAWQTYRAGLIDEQTMRCWSAADGIDPDLWRPVRTASGNRLSPEQVMLWSRLNTGGKDDELTGLRERGWSREPDVQVVQALYDRPPDGPLWLQWHATGALDAPVNELLQRDAGFLEFWTGDPGLYARAHGMTELEGLRRYRAQQPLPQLQQLQEYVYRLRPGVADPANVVTVDTVETLLRAGDTAPKHVDWAMATLYRPMGVGDAVALVRVGLDASPRIEAAYLDAGFKADDAHLLARATGYDAARSYYASVGGWTLSAAVAALQSGMTLPEEVWATLREQGYSTPVVGVAVGVLNALEVAAVARRARLQARMRSARAALTGYQTGALDASAASALLLASGYEAQAAAAVLSAVDATVAAKTVERATESVRKGYLDGELTAVQANVLLSQARIAPERAAQLTAEWQIERVANRPVVQVGAIGKMVSEGLLPLATARQRLVNLGWRDPDLTLQVQAFGAALAKVQAAAQHKGVAAQQAAAKAADRVKQQALKRLEKNRPVAALAQWFKDGLIGEQEVRDRMTRYGYGSKAIDLYIRGWRHQAETKKGSKTAVAGAKELTPQKQVPISKIRAWFLDGIVDEQWARERMTGYGYDSDTVGRYLDEWGQQADYRASKKKPAAPI